MSEILENSEETKKRTPYKLEIEPEDFTSDCEQKFISSNDFCKLLNEYFSAGFSDWYGSTFDCPGGPPYITLYFDHAERVEEGKARACSRISDKVVGNSVIDKTRSRDHRIKEGDRYIITDDGKDIIKPLLLPRYYNQGKPQWDKIVVDYTEQPSFYSQGQQLTKIIGIDPCKVCSLLWGFKNDDGEVMEYGVNVYGDLNIRAGILPGRIQPNYALGITRAHNDVIRETYARFGIGIVGSNIIR